MSGRLTPKQEAFCQAYTSTGNASEAYRASYSAGNMADGSVRSEASKLLSNPNITQRLDEIYADMQEEHGVTRETITRMLLEDRTLAREQEQAAAAATATMGLAKLHGLIINKSEDVSNKRAIGELDAAIGRLVDAARERGASESPGGAGAGFEGDENLPTVPGHGTA